MADKKRSSSSSRTTKRKKPAAWSYTAGERGTNRVRVYDRPGIGLYVDFWGVDALGRRRRVRQALGHSDRARAKAHAETVAAEFRKLGATPRPGRTLQGLLDIYLAEVTPTKTAGKQHHDRTCAEMFARYFGGERDPLTLSRREWDAFVGDRQGGRIAPAGVKTRRTVGPRIIAYDLKFLLACFNWCTKAGTGRGGLLLERNPFHGCPVPKVESPRRPVCTAEQFAALRTAAPRVHPDAEVFLVLTHATGHRSSSVRQLQWRDLDLEDVAHARITWRAETDKMGRAHVTPLPEPAARLLRERQRARAAVGASYVFPSDEAPAEPVSRQTVSHWWPRLEAAAKLEPVKGRGWHSLRRKFATELKGVPLTDVAQLGGWKSVQTLLTCYTQPDEVTMRSALERRGTLTDRGLVAATISTPGATTRTGSDSPR